MIHSGSQVRSLSITIAVRMICIWKGAPNHQANILHEKKDVKSLKILSDVDTHVLGGTVSALPLFSSTKIEQMDREWE